MKVRFKSIFKFIFLRIEKNKLNFNLTLIVIGMFWILFHFVTIERSPLPNFDEAFFASMTKSFQEDGSLMLRMSTMTKFENTEVWLYGPIYFYCQSIITENIGWGIWQFRLLNLIAGFGIVIVILGIARNLKFNRSTIVLLFIMLILDPELNTNMHSGRMDSLAMLFFLIGIYFFYFGRKKSNLSILIASIFFSAAMITTPRVGFLYIILPISFFLEIFFCIKRSNGSSLRKYEFWPIVIKYLFTFIIITVPFLLWIIFRVGGLQIYLKEFTEYDVLKSLVSFFHLPRFYLLPAAIFYLLILIVYTPVFFNRNHINTSISLKNTVIDWQIISISLIPIIYMIFIKGGYYVYMMPVLYLVITYFSFHEKFLFEFWFSRSIRPLKYFYFGLLLINVSIFCLKLSFLNVSWQSRDPKYIEKYLKQKSIKNENVLASHPYHFFISNENMYISNDDNRDLNNIKADKLMIKNAFISVKFYEKEKKYFNKLGFKEIERFSVPHQNEGFLNKLVLKLPLDILTSYNGVYLQRKISSKP